MLASQRLTELLMPTVNQLRLIRAPNTFASARSNWQYIATTDISADTHIKACKKHWITRWLCLAKLLSLLFPSKDTYLTTPCMFPYAYECWNLARYSLPGK